MSTMKLRWMDRPTKQSFKLQRHPSGDVMQSLFTNALLCGCSWIDYLDHSDFASTKPRSAFAYPRSVLNRLLSLRIHPFRRGWLAEPLEQGFSTLREFDCLHHGYPISSEFSHPATQCSPNVEKWPVSPDGTEYPHPKLQQINESANPRWNDNRRREDRVCGSA